MKKCLSNIFLKYGPQFLCLALLASSTKILWAQNLPSISGISSGGSMASQMATAFSNEFIGVATVAGGTYFCAQNHLQKSIEENAYSYGDAALLIFQPTQQFYDDSLNPFAIFQTSNQGKWFMPSKNNPLYQAIACMKDMEKQDLDDKFLEDFEKNGSISPIINIKKQKIVIYQGLKDRVVNSENAKHFFNFYRSNNVPVENILMIESEGGHNFPTDKVGMSACDSQEIPYVSSCNLDLAGKILTHLLGKDLKRTTFNPDHLYRVNQVDNPPSLADYGYLYASDKCLGNPQSCHLHVALHGCEMSDSYDKYFQKKYERQIQMTRLLKVGSFKNIFVPSQSLLVIEERTNRMGLLKFAMQSGLSEYAESEDLMILFPQTWISEINYPYNPKGCWDWFGWTGENYPTNKGAETAWLMSYIKKIAQSPFDYIQKERPEYEILKFR